MFTIFDSLTVFRAAHIVFLNSELEPGGRMGIILSKHNHSEV